MKRASPPSRAELWERFLKTRRRVHKERLVESYMPLVRAVADQLAARLPRTVDDEDLRSAGTFGLFKAIENFDPERKVKFETYCRLRVRGAMIDYLRQQDWIPREARNRGSRLADVIRVLQEKLGRLPTELELSRHLGLTLKEVHAAKTELHFGTMVSLDPSEAEGRVNGEDGNDKLVADEGEPSDILHRREMFEFVKKELT